MDESALPRLLAASRNARSPLYPGDACCEEDALSSGEDVLLDVDVPTTTTTPSRDHMAESRNLKCSLRSFAAMRRQRCVLAYLITSTKLYRHMLLKMRVASSRFRAMDFCSRNSSARSTLNSSFTLPCLRISAA